MKTTDSVVCLTDACNYRCVFCSRRGTKYAHSPATIKKIIKKFPDDVCFEGDEPMLAKDLGRWITFAKRREVRDIILVTNGFGLDKPAAVRKLLALGVTMFNVNFPAHEPKLYDLLTGTKGRFRTAISAVRNLIKTAGPERTRLTLVVNTVIAKYLPGYAEFLVKSFPGLFYVEMNMIKVLGAAAGRPWLMPELSALEPRLLEAFTVLERGKVRFITDGFPLCRMKGFEDHSIDTRLLISRGSPATQEKAHTAPCRACTLKKLCPGPRKDYLARHGTAPPRSSPRRKTQPPSSPKPANSGYQPAENHIYFCFRAAAGEEPAVLFCAKHPGASAAFLAEAGSRTGRGRRISRNIFFGGKKGTATRFLTARNSRSFISAAPATVPS